MFFNYYSESYMIAQIEVRSAEVLNSSHAPILLIIISLLSLRIGLIKKVKLLKIFKECMVASVIFYL